MLASGGSRGVSAGGPLSSRLLATPEALAPSPPPFPGDGLLIAFLVSVSVSPRTRCGQTVCFPEDRCDHVVLLLTAPHCLLLCSRPRGADPARARWTPTPRACNPFPVRPTNTRGRCLSCSVHPEITPGSQPLPRPRSLPRNTSCLLLFWHRSRTATVFGNGRHHSIYNILILVAAFPLTKYSNSRS